MYKRQEWLYTTFKVGAYRCGKYTELIFICWFYADNRICSKHIWSDIQLSLIHICEALNWHTSEPQQGDYTEEYQAYYHEELIRPVSYTHLETM